MRNLRKLSESFMNNLMKKDGVLGPILDRVKKDDTLMLAIRDGYINIYYRGGNLLMIEEQCNNSYTSSFDKQYNKSGKTVPETPKKIESRADAEKWVKTFPHLKEIMDYYFSGKSKAEREFQQLIVRENNFSVISNESEYFISDIEFADSELGARFDMLALRWLAKQRGNGSNCRAAFIEVKYGDKALGGAAGVIKHLQDMDKFISDSESYPSVLETMGSQFNQLDRLGLLGFNRSGKGVKIELDTNDKPEVIFVLANHNPRSTQLHSILDNPKVEEYDKSGRFHLRFFVSSFAGYGLHADCMLPLTQFRKLLEIK